eukprot:3170192-Prorocentrum_lima.AAC.1
MERGLLPRSGRSTRACVVQGTTGTGAQWERHSPVSSAIDAENVFVSYGCLMLITDLYKLDKRLT